MKKIMTIVIGLVVIILIAVNYLMDPLGKKYAQEYAQELLKTSVTISQFDASLLKKELNIDFVEVQNPENFNNKNALSLDHFSLKMGEMGDTLIVIDELKFEGLEFVLEQNNNSVNLTQLLDNLNKSSTSEEVSNKGVDDNEKRVTIKRFKVENMQLKIDTQWLKKTLKVPNISSSNFGGTSGVKLSEIGKQITKEILQNLKRALKNEGVEAGKKKIKETLMRKISDKLGIDSLKKGFSMDNVKEAIDTDALQDKAKKLFKGFGF